MKKSERKGVFVLLLASFFFSVLTIFNRFIPQNIELFFQLFIRAFLISSIFTVVGFVKKGFSKIEKKDLPLFLLRGVFLLIDFACFYIAVNHLPLGTTIFLFYAGSITANFLYGYLIFKEEVNFTKGISLLFATIGLLLLYFDSLLSFASVYAVLGTLSGICFGLGMASSKNLSNKYSVSQVNIISYATAGFLSLLFLFITHPSITLLIPIHSWLALGGISIIGALSFYTALYGLKYIDVQRGSLILLAEILFVILFGFILYNEMPTIKTLIGGIFILSALILPNLNLSFILTKLTRDSFK